MRSKWSAELILTWLAAATMEGAWLTLANVLLQWFKKTGELDLNILYFTLAVAVGMVISRSARQLPQSRYATVITVAVVGAALVGALASGARRERRWRLRARRGARPGCLADGHCRPARRRARRAGHGLFRPSACSATASRRWSCSGCWPRSAA